MRLETLKTHKGLFGREEARGVRQSRVRLRLETYSRVTILNNTKRSVTIETRFLRRDFETPKIGHALVSLRTTGPHMSRYVKICQDMSRYISEQKHEAPRALRASAIRPSAEHLRVQNAPRDTSKHSRDVSKVALVCVCLLPLIKISFWKKEEEDTYRGARVARAIRERRVLRGVA